MKVKVSHYKCMQMDRKAHIFENKYESAPHEDTSHECPLWRSFRSGDSKALARIFNDHYESLYYYGLKLYLDEELVRDCVQNLFLKLWNKRERLGAIKYIKPYLLKSLRRSIGDEVVAFNKKKGLEVHILYECDIAFSCEDFLIASQVSKEQSQALTLSLNKLPKRQKEVLFLKFYEGLSYETIAEVMELNIQSVRNLVHHSLKKMKEHMVKFKYHQV